MILKIYQKYPEYLVSRVEIRLVLNETEVFAYSETGIGFPKFGATVFVPTRVSAMFYGLTIYTCSTSKATNRDDENEDSDYDSPGHLPFYLKPDSELHHIILDNKDEETESEDEKYEVNTDNEDDEDDDDDDEEAERRKQLNDV